MEDYEYGRWIPTPRWHPRYWFGQRMRRWCLPRYALTEMDAVWEYATYGACARQSLEEQFGLPDVAKPKSAILFE